MVRASHLLVKHRDSRRPSSWKVTREGGRGACVHSMRACRCSCPTVMCECVCVCVCLCVCVRVCGEAERPGA
jgi:hypothetical protein